MKQHILFVDDDVPLRETLSLYFKMKGISVTVAESGAEARELVQKNSFNLAIVDLDLGGEKGMELLDFFKRIYPSLPVIMFTSLGYDPALVREAIEKGAHAYLSKTESLDTLLKEAQKAMT